MEARTRYHGVIPALYACYDDQGAISHERTRQAVRHLIQSGVKGAYVSGSSGECIYQSVAERQQTLEAVMEEKREGFTVIAHVACNNTQDSVQLARHAQACGVDAIASIPPIYFRLPEHAIAAYWNTISEAAPETDFILYNIPQLAGVALTPSLLTTMLANPRVAGVKNSSLSVQDIQQFRMLGGPDLVLFNGPDEQYLAGRSMGANGGIGGTYMIMPDLFLKLDQLFRQGERALAQDLQQAIFAIISKTVSGHGNMYAINKEILRQRVDLDLGTVRAPLAQIDASDLPVVEASCRLIDQAVKQFC